MELTSDHDSLRATCDALKSDKHRTEEQVQCCVACLGCINLGAWPFSYITSRCHDRTKTCNNTWTMQKPSLQTSRMCDNMHDGWPAGSTL